jgi:hypothetical protein
MVTQPMILFSGLLTYLPITHLFVDFIIMLTSTTGSRIPFILCDQRVIEISGAPGIRIIPAP